MEPTWPGSRYDTLFGVHAMRDVGIGYYANEQQNTTTTEGTAGDLEIWSQTLGMVTPQIMNQCDVVPESSNPVIKCLTSHPSYGGESYTPSSSPTWSTSPTRVSPPTRSSCDACTAAKVRCRKSQMGPCERCHRKQQKCRYSQSRRSGRRARLARPQADGSWSLPLGESCRRRSSNRPASSPDLLAASVPSPMAPTDFINSQSPQKSTPIGNTPGNVISMATLRREEDEMNISAVCVDVDGVSDQIHGSHQQAPSAPVETMLPQTPASIGSLGADPRSALAEMDASRTNAMNESRMNQTTQSYEPLGHAQLPWWHALEDNTPWTDADVMRDAECHKWQRSEARQARLIRGLADMEAVVQSMELTFDSVLKPLVDARATVDQMGACGVVAPTTPPGDGEDQWHGAECTKTIWSTADLSGQALYGSLSDLRRRLRWFSTDLVGSGDEEYVVGKRI